MNLPFVFTSSLVNAIQAKIQAKICLIRLLMVQEVLNRACALGERTRFSDTHPRWYQLVPLFKI